MFINLLLKQAISLSIARGTIAFEPRECVPHLLRQSLLGLASLCSWLVAHYYIIIYSRIMLINFILGHSFILRKGGKVNLTKKPIGYV